MVDHREEDSSSGRRCHSRTASATASVILEMVPALSARAERGGQVVLDIPHRHSTGVQADDHRIQAVQAALTFAH